MRITVTGLGPAGGVLDTGDGTVVPVSEGVPVKHTYARAGSYMLTATDRYGNTATSNVTVKDHLPALVQFADGEDPWRALLWVDEPDDGTVYQIAWGDGTSEDTVRKVPPPHPRKPHRYTRAGRYGITVTDTSTRRCSRVVFECGALGVLFTFVPGQAYTPRLEALWAAATASWKVDWGDGSTPATGTVPATGRILTRYDGQAPAGRHTVTVTEAPAGVPRRVAVRQIGIPTDWDLGLDVWITWRLQDDPPGVQTVEVTPRNAVAACTVSWGDGTADSQVQPDATASHVYRLPPPRGGWTLAVTEPGQGQAPPRVMHRLLTVPRHVGQPVLNARESGAVDLYVTGANDLGNADWYWISWGDGTSDPMGAVGSTYPAHHTYSAEGVYQIGVDGPGMPEPIVREVTVRTYPTPRVSVREDRPDTGPRRRVALEVDNAGDDRCGGPVVIDWGDGSGLEDGPETGTVTHTYPGEQEQTFVLVVTCKADPTARAQAKVTVPFGEPQSLEVTFSRHRQDPTGCTVELHITAADPLKTVRVNWGDGTPDQEVPASGLLTHGYDNPSAPEPDVYTPRVGYTDGSEVHGAVIEIPFPAEEAQP